MAQAGKVWLVGAGPGDVGLLTRKGYQVLQDADVVVYDSLIGDSLLALLPDHTEKINVGKRASNHTMPQEKINELLLNKAQEGKKVIRLKGGDPSLFGRGGEELELLTEYQVPFEIVPGVTSSIAVPAYNGIPVTHRDFTSSLHIITGHKRAGQGYDIDFDALVRTKGTLVFLMGVSSLGDICRGLLSAGMDADMPAAILQQGTTAGQKRIVATVSTLEEEVKKCRIETPAIIVVGKVCRLADSFAWYEKLPLAGAKILVTRPKDLISTMSDRLRKAGAEVLEMPAISAEPIPDNERLQNALSQMETYQWLVFTSPTGVRIFFDEFLRSGRDLRSLAKLKIAVIGEGTKNELKNRGLIADLIPEIYDGEHLGLALAKECRAGDRILIPRAKIGNQELIQCLDGFEIEDIPTYDTIPVRQSELDLAGMVERGEITCAAFTSSSSVRAFVDANPGLAFCKVRAACIGKQTRATADKAGMQTWMADKATMDSLLELIMQMHAEK
ncbi:MAG: uroporphyrinogen-III C-methyltransferase [Blautia sp.]|nr:uroporphyrinogen-III C-methyltransferase [Blautia sp.]